MRPILMTTTAMIAGMLPIAFALGAGAEARAPMAIAVVGGLFMSTLLTLLVVPVVFSYMDDLQGLLIKSFTRVGPIVQPSLEGQPKVLDEKAEPIVPDR